MTRGCAALAGVLGLLLTAGAAAAGAEAPLVEAVKHGDAPAMRALLRRHAGVDIAAADGSTALHWAAFREDVQAAEALIRAGANVQAATRLGVTPLALACATGSGATSILVGTPSLALGDKLDFYVTGGTGAAHRVTVVIKATVN